MNIDCCKSYVGKQIIGLLPSQQDCLYYLVIDSLFVSGNNFTGCTINGQPVGSVANAFFNSVQILGGTTSETAVFWYTGTQPDTIVVVDAFDNEFPFTYTKVTDLDGSCDPACYQASFDYGYVVQYFEYFTNGGAYPATFGGISIDDQTSLYNALVQMLGPDITVSSVWNGSQYVVTINGAFSLGSPLQFDDGAGNVVAFDLLPCEITPPEPVPLDLLSAYPGASAAYSVRKLSSSYTGAALRVRRSSDNTEQDIAFDSNGDLDQTSLTTFVGAGSGFVTKWYDQSGNGNDSYNTVGSNQPRIVNSGTVEVQNSKPSVRFIAASAHELVLTNTLNINTSWSCYTVLTRASTSDSIASICNNTTSGYTLFLTSNKNYVWYTNTARESTNSLTNLNLYSVYNNDTNIYINNVANATSLTLTLAGNNFNRIGKRGSTNSEGYISEIIFYPTNQLSNNTAINTNITNYYGI